MDGSAGVQSLADFQRATREDIRRLVDTGRPCVLTIDGELSVVVLDVAAYQTLLDRLDRAEAIEPHQGDAVR